MKLHSKIYELLAEKTRLEADIGNLKEEKEKKIEAEKKAIMGIVMTGQACGLTILANPIEEASSNGAAKNPHQATGTDSTQINDIQETLPSSSTATSSLLSEAAPVAPTCSTSSNHHSESSACTTPDESSELPQTSAAGSSGKVSQSDMWEAAVQNADTAPIYSDPMLFSLHCLFSATVSKDLPKK